MWKEIAMKKRVTLFVIVAVPTGCNTVAGVGKDIEKAGEAVQDAAETK